MTLYTMTLTRPNGTTIAATDYWHFQVWEMAEMMIPAGYQVNVEPQEQTSYPFRMERQ